MKVLSLVLLIFIFAAGIGFAETSERVYRDADVLLGQQTDRSRDNHLFMETYILTNYENRMRLNDFRTRFNAVTARITNVRHQIVVAISYREPRVTMIAGLRNQLEQLINEHDAILDEFRQWVSTLQ